jgi:hypothetical protein
MTVDLKSLNDESLLARFENIRRQADADRELRGEFRLVSDSNRQYVGKLQQEMERRAMRFTPIDWG